MAPRAQIFRRDQNTAQDIGGFEKLLRYNDYENDPFSGGSPNGAICSRGDLTGTSSVAGGCYDSKMTTASLFNPQTHGGKGGGMQAWAINGPTDEPSGAFCWSTSAYNNSDSHMDMPDCFDFEWELFVPPTSFE